MFWYKDIYELYFHSHFKLFTTSFYITDICWKYYIAIMAVSTIKSEYLLSLLESQFLYYGGEETWINFGLSHVPNKLQSLAKINNIIAHQPWKLNSKDILELFEYWTKEELLEALLLIVFFQRQASILESLKLRLRESDDEQEKISELIYSPQEKIGVQLFDCIAELNGTDEDNENNEKEKEKEKERIDSLMKNEMKQVQTKEVIPQEHIFLINKSKFKVKIYIKYIKFI